MPREEVGRRRARITATVLAVPVLVVSAVFAWALFQLIPPGHRGAGGGVLLMSGLGWLGVLASLVAVYAAPNAHVAWRRGGPVVVLGGFALLFLSDVAIELLGQQ